MSAGYREQPRRCPSCHTMMGETTVGEAQIDVCSECSGVWLDWLDGDMGSVSHQASMVLPKGAGAGAGAMADGPCPDCGVALYEQILSRATVLRCGECAGAFITRAALDAVARSERVAEERGLLAAIARLARRLVGADD